MSRPQIKSKARVRDHGEVYTAEREVNAMLDLVKGETERIDSVFLEPACGDGNFLVEIYRRKLEHCQTPADGVRALASIYAVDILLDNVQESKKRLYEMFKARFGEADRYTDYAIWATLILNANIMWGDSLTGKRMADGKHIWFLPRVAYEPEDGQTSLF